MNRVALSDDDLQVQGGIFGEEPKGTSCTTIPLAVTIVDYKPPVEVGLLDLITDLSSRASLSSPLLHILSARLSLAGGQEAQFVLLEMVALPSVRRKLAALESVVGILEGATDDQLRLFEKGSRRRPLLGEDSDS